MNLETLTLQEQIDGLREKKFSSVELVENYISVIEDKEDLNIFVSNDFEKALEKAKKSDGSKKSQEDVPLNGIPMVHKDIFCTKGIKTSCGSKMLDNFYPPYSATVVEKLEQAGSICLGKANMDEFAMGSSNETSFYGAVKNPLNIKKTPGGSSGGSAAAVAANFSSFSTGTDTGGSIRQPASLTGICGIKPTYGRVSRYGMIAFASSLDQAGVFTRTAEDCAMLLNEISGYDSKDSTSSNEPVPNYLEECRKKFKPVKIGLPKEFLDGLEDSVRKIFDDAVLILEKSGCRIKEISLKTSKLGVSAYQVVAPAECSSNLSRFDGVRFGHRAKDVSTIDELYKKSRSEGFGNEVKRRLLVGTYALSAGYYDAYYIKAQKIRNVISQEFREAFDEVDLILGPTTPDSAFKIGEKLDDPIAMYLSDVFTVSTNLAGLPAISIPMGLKNELPIGLQIIGNHFDESKILSLSHHYQQITDWHSMMPNMETL